MGRRLDRLTRIFTADNSLNQYRAEIASALRDNLQDEKRQQAEAMAYGVYQRWKEKATKQELEDLIKDYDGREPATPPRHSGTRYTLDKGWGGEEVSFTGPIAKATSPDQIAHAILDPMARAQRRKGDTHLRDQLAGIVGQLQEQFSAIAEKERTANILLAALEEVDTLEPEKLTWKKIDPIRAGCLPRHCNNAKYQTGSWPPSSPAERQRAAEIFREYKTWLEMPDKIEAVELDDQYAGWYAKVDEYQEVLDKLLREFRTRAAMDDPTLGLTLGEEQIDRAMARAERDVF